MFQYKFESRTASPIKHIKNFQCIKQNVFRTEVVEYFLINKHGYFVRLFIKVIGCYRKVNSYLELYAILRINNKVILMIQ